MKNSTEKVEFYGGVCLHTHVMSDLPSENCCEVGEESHTKQGQGLPYPCSDTGQLQLPSGMVGFFLPLLSEVALLL